MSEDDPLRAHMALDGELDAAHARAFEAELSRSPERAAEYAALVALRTTVRTHAPREAAPAALRARIAALAADEAPRARPRWREAALAAGVAAVAALAGFAAGRTQSGGGEAGELVAFAQRAALSGQPVDVVSSDRHTVKPWLAARTPLGVLALDLAADGFPLLGGRLDVIAGQPAPTLVYRRREHLISVSEFPLAQAPAAPAALDGYHFERWQDRERAYVAVSDLDPGELAAFAARFRDLAAR